MTWELWMGAASGFLGAVTTRTYMYYRESKKISPMVQGLMLSMTTFPDTWAMYAIFHYMDGPIHRSVQPTIVKMAQGKKITRNGREIHGASVIIALDKEGMMTVVIPSQVPLTKHESRKLQETFNNSRGLLILEG